MTLETITFILGWSTVLNYIALFLWFSAYVFGSDKIYQFHSHWFAQSREQFSQLHYLGMMVYKIAIFMFFLTPYMSLKLLTL